MSVITISLKICQRWRTSHRLIAAYRLQYGLILTVFAAKSVTISPRIKIEIDNARIPYLIDNSNPDFLVNEQFKKKLLKHIPAKKLKLLNDWIILNYDTLMQHWNGEISDKMALNALKSIETS